MGIAAQNQVYVALSNRIGKERDLGFTGASMIAGWDGFAVAGPAPGDEEALLVAETDLSEATRKRQRNPRNHVIDDRRPDMYVTEPGVVA